MAGTLTITSPATDSEAGHSTTTLPIAWTFTGTGTATQVQRRVVMKPVGSTTVVLDTGMQSSTETTHTVGNLSSGVSYTVTVTVVDTAGATTAASRIIVSSYIRPLPATVVFTDVEYALQVAVVNLSDGARPDATTNDVYRRLAGTADDWTFAGTVGNNGILTDYRVQANTAYDYFVRTNGAVDSDLFTVTVGPVYGAWAHVPDDPAGTLVHFLHAAGAAESVDMETTFLQFVGRTYPVAETGPARTDTLAVSIRLPPDARQAGEDWWRARKRAGDVFYYRDGRTRAWPVVLDGPAQAAPDSAGSVITATLHRVDYLETILPAGSYGVYGNTDGGYGTGGYGTNGYGT